ncbi:hypothetical protein C2845_PM08G20850 [Panicum miliaceum]|uniref:Uncharacterized protein n=1 Tax=Panicum miliaceum TaxID=4540 RepID=A0A3L6R5C7_PANMI|nr:hypothetical protein C2845_PM08G20850 [Panicum miliaceum]
MLQMYVNRNYVGEDVLLVNSVTITSSVGVLLTYFLNGKEHTKYWILMIIFAILETEKILNRNTRSWGITGIVLFALDNVMPFSDLWAMISGDRTDLTLLMPMMINTFLGCLASALWAFYAWVFDPKQPNYFMIANSVAAGLAFVQVLWLLVLRILHREVVGQITDVESLRETYSLAAAASAAATEAGANQATVAKQVATSNAVAARASANAALALCRSFLGTCRTNMTAIDDMKRATKNKLSADVPIAGEDLQTSIKVASEATRGLANHLRSSIQIINASEGIPSTVKIAFNFCREQILSIKNCADSPFLSVGVGAFSFRRHVNRLKGKITCSPNA